MTVVYHSEVMTGCAHHFEILDPQAATADHRVVISHCSACGLRLRETVVGEQVRKVEVKLRASWPWVNAVELLTLNLPVRVCSRCLVGPGGCERCHGAGVVPA